MSLVGKFIVVNDGDYYKTGEVAECVTPELYMIKVDSVDFNTPPSFVLMHCSDMVDSGDGEGCVFFNSRKELENWIAWINTPSDTPKVVQFKKADK